MANDIQALIPEWWAFESLRILTKSLVVANVVNRDYDGYFAKGGDVVNINRTGTFTAVRKQKGSPIIIQDAIVEGDTVKLNQHLTYHSSWMIVTFNPRSWTSRPGSWFPQRVRLRKASI
jgi:hypothetical protein